MRITHLDVDKDMSDYDKQLLINQLASFYASVLEAMDIAAEHDHDGLPIAVLARLIYELFHNKETMEYLEKATKAGLSKDMTIFQEVDGKANLPENVVSFGEKKKDRTIH